MIGPARLYLENGELSIKSYKNKAVRHTYYNNDIIANTIPSMLIGDRSLE